jgi:hypothetical protein
LTDGEANVAIGYGALGTEDQADANVAVGVNALATQNAGTSESYNTAVGHNAGRQVTTGVNNTIIGGLAGDALTNTSNNVAVGTSALSSDTLGGRTVAIGSAALEKQNFTTATSSNNVAVGFTAGQENLTGTGLTLVGSAAGENLTSGSNNTFIGHLAAGQSSITGTLNTSIGYAALYSLTSGSNNVGLGRDSGRTGAPGGKVTTASGQLCLGDENITNAHIQVSLTVASDERDKTDFVDLDLGLDFVKSLEPVTYYWDKRAKYLNRDNADGTPNTNYDLDSVTPDGTHKEDWMDLGFKAQSVQALEEAAGYKMLDKKNLTVHASEDGKQMALKYEKFVPILVKAIKDQDAIITSLTARITALES